MYTVKVIQDEQYMCNPHCPKIPLEIDYKDT